LQPLFKEAKTADRKIGGSDIDGAFLMFGEETVQDRA
jgi:hypothetical protein